MNDLHPPRHGDEGEGSTHFMCSEVMERDGKEAKCCACSGHKCKEAPPQMKEERVDISAMRPHPPRTKEEILAEVVRDICAVAVTAAPKSKVREILSSALDSLEAATLRRVEEILEQEMRFVRDERQACKNTLAGKDCVSFELYYFLGKIHILGKWKYRLSEVRAAVEKLKT